MAFFLDDAVGAVAGGAIAVGLEVGKDVVTGEKVTGGSLFGAFVGGVLLAIMYFTNLRIKSDRK